MPGLNPATEIIATAFDIVPVPRGVVPSRKVTVPVAPAVTVAVSVTPAPYVEGFGVADRLMLGVALLTTRVIDVEDDPYTPSPLYTTVPVYVPALAVAGCNEVEVVPPDRVVVWPPKTLGQVTVPVAPAVTVAVQV